MRAAVFLSLAATLVLPGCFAPLDLSHRSCPCTEGWACEPTTQTCVQNGIDAASPIDTSPRDTGIDAAAMDAGSDAAMADAGRVDDAGMDALVVNDVGVDGGHDAASSIDAATTCTARICDDFESASATRIPPWQWMVGAASRSTTRPHAGTASGHFSLPATGGGDRQQAIGVDLASTITDVWLRFYAYVPSTAMAQNIGITSIADMPGTNDSILIQDSGWAFYAGGPDVYRGSIPVTPDHWTCLSFHTVLTSPGSITLTVDHLTPLSATGINAAFPTGLNNVEVGLTFVDVSQVTAFDYFVDDVALTVDGTTLPCP